MNSPSERLATLRRLWSEFPAGTREFIGNYGADRAAMLAEFETALGITHPPVSDVCACPVPGWWALHPERCPTCNRTHREKKARKAA